MIELKLVCRKVGHILSIESTQSDGWLKIHDLADAIDLYFANRWRDGDKQALLARFHRLSLVVQRPKIIRGFIKIRLIKHRVKRLQLQLRINVELITLHEIIK